MGTMLEQDFASGVFGEGTPPCLSLYQPTARHHPDNQQDPIRFGNLVKDLERSLLKQVSPDEAASLLEPFRELERDHDFWQHTLDGLAVLGARDQFHVYRLQQDVAPMAIVADSFHTKPLLRIRQSADRFQILALNRKSIRLFEGTQQDVDEVELANDVPATIEEALGSELTEPHLTVASYGSVSGAMAPATVTARGAGGAHSAMHHGHGGRKSQLEIDDERFFRAVDRAVLEHHSKVSHLPLILAALPEHQALFRSLSHNTFLLDEGLEVNPEALPSKEEFRRRARAVMEPRYKARTAALADKFQSARANGLGDESVHLVARAAVAGRVKSVMLEARREIPGRIDQETGAITRGQLDNPRIDDVLDDLAALVAGMGGDVVVVRQEEMPTSTGVAAIYRFGADGQPPSPLEEQTVDELYARAKKLRITGRSTMRKAELIEAIQAAS